MKSEDYQKQGGSAFPVPSSTMHNKDDVFAGLTVRQYYAGHALAGMLANPTGSNETDLLVRSAYLIADAMIAHEKQEEDAKN